MKIPSLILLFTATVLLYGCINKQDIQYWVNETFGKSRFIHITDVSRPQVFHLKTNNGHPNSLILTITSDLDSKPSFRFYSRLYNKTHKEWMKDTTSQKGVIEYFEHTIELPTQAEAKEIWYDWYSDTLTLYYLPKKATKGEIMIKWKLG